MVHLRTALEDGLKHALGPDDPRVVLCHRGTLDPLAYWLDRGWPEDEFYTSTDMDRIGHYRRYAAVLHLVSAADGAADSYRRWPDAHRPEQPEDAIRLDRLLEHAWGDHPCYNRIDNEERDWPGKAQAARAVLECTCAARPATEETHVLTAV